MLKIIQVPFWLSYLTSSAKAIIPAARGADAEVPVCFMVQLLYKSVVTCIILQIRNEHPIYTISEHIRTCRSRIFIHSPLWSSNTYYHLITKSSRRICYSQHRRTSFSIPRKYSPFIYTSNWNSVNTVHITIAVTVVTSTTSISRSPNKNTTFTLATLKVHPNYIAQKYCYTYERCSTFQGFSCQLSWSVYSSTVICGAPWRTVNVY